MNYRYVGHSILNGLKRSSPTILSIISIFGVGATGVMSAMCVPKAQKRIAEKEAKLERELSTVEKFFIALPAFGPAIGSGIGTGLCIAGANILNQKQQALLAAAVPFLERQYTEHKDKVKEILANVGLSDKVVEEEIVKDHLKEDKPVNEEPEKPLFYNPFAKDKSKGYFNCSLEDAQYARYAINHNLTLRGYVSVNELLAFFGVPDDTNETFCDVYGWDTWTMTEEWEAPWLEIEFDKVCTDDGLECYMINVMQPPHLDETLFPGCRAQIERTSHPGENLEYAQNLQVL